MSDLDEQRRGAEGDPPGVRLVVPPRDIPAGAYTHAELEVRDRQMRDSAKRSWAVPRSTLALGLALGHAENLFDRPLAAHTVTLFLVYSVAAGRFGLVSLFDMLRRSGVSLEWLDPRGSTSGVQTLGLQTPPQSPQPPEASEGEAHDTIIIPQRRRPSPERPPTSPADLH